MSSLRRSFFVRFSMADSCISGLSFAITLFVVLGVLVFSVLALSAGFFAPGLLSGDLPLFSFFLSFGPGFTEDMMSGTEKPRGSSAS